MRPLPGSAIRTTHTRVFNIVVIHEICVNLRLENNAFSTKTKIKAPHSPEPHPHSNLPCLIPLRGNDPQRLRLSRSPRKLKTKQWALHGPERIVVQRDAPWVYRITGSLDWAPSHFLPSCAFLIFLNSSKSKSRFKASSSGATFFSSRFFMPSTCPSPTTASTFS